MYNEFRSTSRRPSPASPTRRRCGVSHPRHHRARGRPSTIDRLDRCRQPGGRGRHRQSLLQCRERGRHAAAGGRRRRRSRPSPCQPRRSCRGRRAGAGGARQLVNDVACRAVTTARIAFSCARSNRWSCGSRRRATRNAAPRGPATQWMATPSANCRSVPRSIQQALLLAAGPRFCRSYELMFVRTGCDGSKQRLPIDLVAIGNENSLRVTLVPSELGKVCSAMRKTLP